MPDARVLSALLGIGIVMTHIFFNRGGDHSRPRTRGQAKIEAEKSANPTCRTFSTVGPARGVDSKTDVYGALAREDAAWSAPTVERFHLCRLSAESRAQGAFG